MVFVHHLQCRNGLGDRLLDTWAVLAIARIIDPSKLTRIVWYHGYTFEGFIGTYNVRLLDLPNCELVQAHEEPKRVKVTHPYVPMECILCSTFKGIHTQRSNILPFRTPIQVHSACHECLDVDCHDPRTNFSNFPKKGATSEGDDVQIGLPVPFFITPEIVHRSLPYYGVSINGMDMATIMEVYQHVISHTRPTGKIAEKLEEKCNELSQAIGVHIRWKDKKAGDQKVSVVDSILKMNTAELDIIMSRCKKYLVGLCSTNKRVSFYICSDDCNAKREFQNTLRALGANVIQHGDTHNMREDELALLDFFSLAMCKEIVQGTKYSTFSLAASMIRQIPLVNFYGWKNNPLSIWRTLANIRMEEQHKE